MKCNTKCPEGERPIGAVPTCALSGVDECTEQWEGQLATFEWKSPEWCQCQCWTSGKTNYNVTINASQGEVAGGEILKKSDAKMDNKHFSSNHFRCDGDPLTLDGVMWGNLGQFHRSQECKKACIETWACVFAMFNRLNGKCTAFGACTKMEDKSSEWDIYEKVCAAQE